MTKENNKMAEIYFPAFSVTSCAITDLFKKNGNQYLLNMKNEKSITRIGLLEFNAGYFGT
jgi:hypothetical protein